jgi:hypothetical protein
MKNSMGHTRIIGYARCDCEQWFDKKEECKIMTKIT